MKTAVLSLAAISLIELVVAQPHRRHAHQAAHAKKDVVTIVNTVFAEATSGPQIIVYVDQAGKPISTETQTFVGVPGVPAAAATPAPAALPVISVLAAVVKPTTSAPPAPVASSASASSSSAAPSSSSPPVSGSSGYGVTYNPYNNDGTCKTASQVLGDIKALGSGYGVIRTYGVDCNTVSTVYAACKSQGLKLFQGIFDISQVTSAVASIVSGVGGDWSSVHTVSVGNELVNGGQASVSDVLAAVSTARTLLRAAGYKGPVVTVDTLVATLAHPQLCDSSDYCAVNSHPFFDPNTAAANAGSFLTTSIASLKNVLANKSQTIIITETGWPSKGDTNGQAVPSTSNQAAAISSIKSAFSSNPAGVILFNPYNMHWKTSSAGQFDAEPWWGFLGDCPSG